MARPPRAVVAAPPSESRTLSEQFAQAAGECRATRRALKPLRDEVRERAREVLATVADSSSPTRVRMQRPDGGGQQVLELSCAERGSAARPPAHESKGETEGGTCTPCKLGIRCVCQAARDAAYALHSVPRQAFDAALREEMRARLLTAGAQTEAKKHHYLKVRVRKE